MSLFGSLLGDMDDDLLFGSHMRTMRQMNTMMNSLFSDPFSMFPDFDNHHRRHAAITGGHHPSPVNSLMPFGSFPMMNLGGLLSGALDSPLGGGASSLGYSSSTVVSMTTGPDGRPQVYKATSSTRTAPGGIKETQRTVSDSRTGTKKMAIGHHIGDRAHIIEREQNLRSGDQEERQDFINIEEDEAEDFNREWEQKTRSRSEIPRITSGGGRHGGSYGGHHHGGLLAITGGPSSRRQREKRTAGSGLVAPRRSIRSPSSPLLALPTTAATTSTTTSSSTKPKPYSVPGQHQQLRRNRNIKTVSSGDAYNVSDSDEEDDNNDKDDEGVKIEEIN